MDIFFAVITVSTIMFIVHVRINRMIFDIEITAENTENFLLLFKFVYIYSGIFTIFSMLLILLLYKKPGKWSVVIQKLRLYIDKYNVFFKGYTVIFEKLTPHGTKYLVVFVKKVLQLSWYKKIIFILFFFLLPRIIIVLCLIIDVFYLKRLHLYYYSLVLLIIPLFGRMLFFILKDISPRMLPAFEEMLNFSEDSTQQVNENVFFVSITLKPKFSHYDLDDLLYNFYYPLSTLPIELVLITPLYIKINLYSQLIYYVLHVISFGYILYFVV